MTTIDTETEVHVCPGCGHSATVHLAELPDDQPGTCGACERGNRGPFQCIVVRGEIDPDYRQPTGRVDEHELRRLPGQETVCSRCRSLVVWAVTAARDTGPGGKPMPLDPVEHPDGNVAVSPGHGSRLVARVLKKDEQPIVPVEFRAMPHFATCGKGTR